MSKLKHKPKPVPESAGYTDGMRDEPLTANGIDRKEADDIVEVLQQREEEARTQINNEMAKIMTNDETPRCPFCLSVKIQQAPPMMGSFNRFTCMSCMRSFREPATEERKKSA